MTGTTSAEINIKISGAPLNPMVRRLLASAEVQSNLFLPSQFRLAFRGRSTNVLTEAGLQLGELVMLTVTTGGAPKPLLTGEITAVDLEYGPEGRLTVVRGYDLAHRLMRGNNAMAYPDMTASEVVEAYVAELVIPVGVIEPTTATYPWLSQANVSPWVFIQQLAALENHVAYVDSMGMFHFRPMPKPESGLPPVMSYSEPATGSQLVLGKNLIRLRGSVTGSEQVPAVTVTGYDPSKAMPVLGPQPSMPSTSLNTDPLTLPVAVAGEMKAKPFSDARVPVTSEGAARKRAAAVSDDITASMAELEGQALGNPSILAGKSVSIGMAGLPFDGQYICTSASHVFDPGGAGYTTWFTLGGRKDRSLFSLTSGNNTSDYLTRSRIPGLVVGTVVDNMDPESLGRVKVRFPWLSETYVSAWARTVQIGAGAEGGYGFLFLPEVGDEVLVGFDRGHIDYPYVIGNLYNGLGKPEPAPSVEGGVANRRIMSRMRHMIQFDDGPSALGITISDGDQTVSIKLDAKESAITITAAGQVTVQAAKGITLDSAKAIQLQAAEDINLQAGKGVSISSGESFQAMAGQNAAIVAGEGVSVSAPEVSLGA